MRIDPDGSLTIFSIAIDRVPRRWRDELKGAAGRIVADDPEATKPRLIDRVTIRARRTG